MRLPPAWSRAAQSIAGTTLVLLAAACADPFVVSTPEGGPALAGEIAPTVIPAGPGITCDGFAVELQVGFDPTSTVYPGGGQDPVGYLSGRAYPRGSAGSGIAERAFTSVQPWWIEGDIYENGVATLMLYQSTILPNGPPDAVGAKPYSTFRGTYIGNRLDVAEAPTPPFCGRRLVAEPGGATVAAVPGPVPPGVSQVPTPALPAGPPPYR